MELWFFSCYKHLIFIFITTFLIYWIFGFFLVYEDTIPSYGFSYAIANGEIPYRDFNIISTPLYSFLMSIGLFIYDDFLTIIIESGIIYILIIFLLYKLFKDKLLYIMPLFIIFFLLKTFIPTYNLLLILLLLIILLLEKNNKSDFIIGLLLGLLILTKHSIGLIIAFISLLLVIKDKKRLFKRLSGLIIPCLIFILYLLLTNSISQFIDLCILGMFDFANHNNYINKTSLILIIIIFLLNIILLIKYKNKDPKELIYSLGCISFIIPIIDQYHTCLYIFISLICILLYLFNNKIIVVNKIKNYIHTFFISLNIILLIVCYILLSIMNNNINRISIPHFKYTNMIKDRNIYIKDIYNKYNEYDKVIMLGKLSTIMDISSNKDITYFNVLLYGNWGKNINKKSKDKINNMHNIYIFIENNNDITYQDYTYIKDYVYNNYKKVDSIYDYDIYYKE